MNFGIPLMIEMHWQQWFVLASAFCGLVVTPFRPTLALKFFGVFWTFFFLWVLASAGFFTGGM